MLKSAMGCGTSRYRAHNQRLISANSSAPEASGNDKQANSSPEVQAYAPHKTKQSVYSKKLPPDATKFIEVTESDAKTEKVRRIQWNRSSSCETQDTPVSSATLPPLVPKKKVPVAPKHSRPTGFNLPNVIGTPNSSRPNTRVHSRTFSLEQNQLSSGSRLQDSEIIGHRRRSSLDSLMVLKSQSQKKTSLIDHPSPHAVATEVSEMERNSSFSDSSSYVVVRRKIRVAWEGNKRPLESTSKVPMEASSSDAESSRTTGSCSTCEPDSSRNLQSSSACQKGLILSEEANQIVSCPDPNHGNPIRTSDKVAETPTAEVRLTDSADKNSRTSSALARLRQLRQFSLSNFTFGRKQPPDAGSISLDGKAPELMPPAPNDNIAGKKPRPERKARRGQPFFRSRTIDFALLNKKDAAESLRKDGGSLSPTGRKPAKSRFSTSKALSKTPNKQSDSSAAAMDNNNKGNSADLQDVASKAQPSSIESDSSAEHQVEPLGMNNLQDCSVVHQEFFNGGGWRLLGGFKQGQTQTDSPQLGEKAYFCHPIDVHLSTRTIQGWPKIHVEVWHQDNFGRQELYGYGFCHVPTSPGEHLVEFPTWRPAGSSREEALQRFVGGGLQLRNPETVFNATDRFKINTVAMGNVQLSLGVILRNFDKFGIQC